jgi:16S rRNA (adenine1518-N6/adenine1519-N6)-dimethyltransferase
VTLSRRDARELLERHGLSPRKAFGQNFVVDPNTVRRIARLAAVGPDDRVIEIGPGLGSLTLALAETGAAITAIELDRGFVPLLQAELEPKGITIIEGDALRHDWNETLGSRLGWVLVSNLPYNIATPLVCDILDGVPQINRMLVMVQREVGERMVAKPSTPAYGGVTVKIGYWATAKIVGSVPASVFLPPPKVESALVSITRRPEPLEVDRELLFQLVRAGFAHRRKMLRGSIGALVPAEAFEVAAIRPEARAEELDVTDWVRLARTVTDLQT